MPRILYVTSYFDPAYVYGGPVSAGLAWCETLARRGMHIDVLTTNANGKNRLDVPINQPVQKNGINITYFQLDSHIYFYSRDLVHAIQRAIPKYDIVYMQTMWGHAFVPGARSALSARIPYVIELVGQLLPWSLRQKRFKKWLYLTILGKRYLDRASALRCTDVFEAQAAKQLGLRAPTQVIPNAVDDAFFQSDLKRGVFRQRLNIPGNARILTFLGRLHYKKNPGVVLEALVLAGEIASSCHIVFVGPDHQHWVIKLAEAAKQLNIEGRVHFTGLLNRQGVLEALADTDLLIMPSAEQSENFGMSAAEALAAGVPVLTSAGVPVGIQAQSVGAGQVATPSAQAMGAALRELLGNPESLRDMGIRARNFALSTYHIEAVADLLIAQVSELIT